MVKNIIVIALVLSTLFTGCATTLETSKNTVSKEGQASTKSSDKDDFLEEFEDEFSEEQVEEGSDPLRGYNVFMTSFNDSVYTDVFNPLARGYSNVVPEGARKSIKNFFNNLLYPMRFVNNVLQLKFANAGEETGRFVVNTTIGILGLFDPAKEYLKLEPHNEDFGQTLGHWGVGGGYHIVLPFFGPSNVRDMLSMYPDSILNPITYSNHTEGYSITQNEKQSILVTVYQKVNRTSLKLGEYEDLKKDAVDLYPFLKDIYEQHREKLIKE